MYTQPPRQDFRTSLMMKLLNFILWPALAGLVFAAVLLLVPRIAAQLPGLENYFPQYSQSLSTGVLSEALSYSSAVKKAAPAVVSINSLQTIGRPTEIYVNPFRTEAGVVVDENNSLGSGVIINPEGFIVTSYHVFFNPALEVYSRDITVSLSDGRNVEARLVALDEKNDLALLKIDLENLPFLSLANSGLLQVGDVVLAIGNPRNIGQSVTSGIISALLKRQDNYVIQTDAAINPGNSGGALIDVNGKLIGINSTIVSESGGSEGISFAIPASNATTLLKQYLASGPSGYLGIDANVLPLEEGRELFGEQLNIQGFRILHIVENSSAFRAGLEVNDIITGVNNTKFKLENDEDIKGAVRSISGADPGQLVMIEVFRDGKFLKIPTILGMGEPQVGCDRECLEDLKKEAGITPPETSVQKN